MTKCSVENCQATGIHRFPKNETMRQLWIKAIPRKDFQASSSSRLCGAHFKDEDYLMEASQTGCPHERRTLKKSAVPSNFIRRKLSGKKYTKAQSRVHKESVKKRLWRESIDKHELSKRNLIQPSSVEKNVEVVDEGQLLGGVPEIVEPINETCNKMKGNETEKKEFRSTGVQSNCALFSIDMFRGDDKGLQFYTGLENSEKFRLVFDTLAPYVDKIKYMTKPVTTIAAEDQLLLVLMKLKRNTVEYELSRFFAISECTIANIFITWINFMYQMWSLIDIWPSREVIDFFMPKSFKKYFPTTRVIIDGTEVPIQKPTNPIAQQATFSSYKNRNTAKVLVGATPDGLLSYCSPLYGGTTSDRQIVERSNLIEKCEQKDSIMADRGFNVQDIFASKGITINIPNFLKGKDQLPGMTVLKDRKLASKRVHIERLIGLIETYQILRSPLNPYIIPLASRIYFVCFMLCNFREGIVSKDA